MYSIPIRVGGRLIADTADLVRRYAGLPWSHGEREIWAWPYFDAVPSAEDDVVTPLDVLPVAALHPGLSRSDLAYFLDHADDLRAWLADVPNGDARPNLTALWFADDALLAHLDQLVELADGINLTLLTKVLHRKRPELVPLLDRHIVDRYRQLTGERRPVEAWPGVIRALRDDLADPETRLRVSVEASQITKDYRDRTGHDARLGVLRYIDIAVWMETR